MGAQDSLVLQEARALYNLGMNVFPIPCVDTSFGGNKPPYGSTAILETGRLDSASLPVTFIGANLAVKTGRTSRNLFIIDIDTEKAFASIGTALAQQGIATWTRNSARGGQFWFFCAEGEVASAKRGAIDVIGAGANHYVVAPPSIHPTGMLVEWLERPDPMPLLISLESLRFLDLPLEVVSRHSAGRDTLLPPKAHQVLVLRDSTAFGGDNSLAELVACESLVAAGYTDDAIYDLFLQHRPPHFVKRKCSREWLQKHVLSHARAFITNAPRDPRSDCTRVETETVRRWVDSRPWPGRTGATDRAVMLALCQRATREKSAEFRASIREVAELAGVGVQAAIDALDRLQGRPPRPKKRASRPMSLPKAPDTAPLIESVGEDAISAAKRYRFLTANMAATEPDVVRHSTTEGNPVNTDGMTSDNSIASPVNLQAHDAWHAKALGKTCLMVWRTLLTCDEMTEEEVTSQTGKARSTVRKALDRLAAAGLAHRIVSKWEGYPATEQMLDSIARHFATHGCAEARAERHRDERGRRIAAIIQKQRREWEGLNWRRLLRGRMFSVSEITSKDFDSPVQI